MSLASFYTRAVKKNNFGLCVRSSVRFKKCHCCPKRKPNALNKRLGFMCALFVTYGRIRGNFHVRIVLRGNHRGVDNFHKLGKRPP
jgi:hypothetical protein